MFIEEKVTRSLMKALWLVFILTLALSFIGGQNRQEESGAEKIAPLVKINLLPQKEMSLPPVLRDIFSPQVYLAPVSISFSGKQDSESGQKVTIKQGEEEETASSGLRYRPSVRYIGYVHSAGKTVALLIVNGLAMPVEAGEFIVPEFQVLKITPEEVIVVGPDKEKLRFSLEGDKNEEA